MKKSVFLLGFILLAIGNTSMASTEQENGYLVQLINQLNAMKPIILAAEKEQPSNQRITFHYTTWKDDKGQRHNGLLEDVNAIQEGIKQKLNNTMPESRAINPIRGDYLMDGSKMP